MLKITYSSFSWGLAQFQGLVHNHYSVKLWQTDRHDSKKVAESPHLIFKLQARERKRLGLESAVEDPKSTPTKLHLLQQYHTS